MIEGLGPEDHGRPRLDKLHRHDDAPRLPAHGAAGDIVDIQPPPGLLRTNAAIGEGENGAAGDDEQAPELCEPGDDVASEAVRKPAAGAGFARLLGEWHHGKRGAAAGGAVCGTEHRERSLRNRGGRDPG